MKKNKKWFCAKCEYCLQITELGDVMCEHSAFKTDRKGDLKPYFKNNATVMDAPAYCKNYTKREKGYKSSVIKIPEETLYELAEFLGIKVKEKDNDR